MTKQQIAILLERVESWPQEAQDELIRSALAIERRHGGVYRLDDEERADIREGIAEIERGEVATDEDVKATFEHLRRR
jgi:predicted transcriptional regulator